MAITIGLYYNGARYLAAWLGRWTSADPIGIGADGPGLYNYTRGSPVNYTDPSGTTGLDTVSDIGDRVFGRPLPAQPAPEPQKRFDPDRLTADTLSQLQGPAKLGRELSTMRSAGEQFWRYKRLADIAAHGAGKVWGGQIKETEKALRADAWGTLKDAVNPKNIVDGLYASAVAGGQAAIAAQRAQTPEEQARLIGVALAHTTNVVTTLAPLPKTFALLGGILGKVVRAVEAGLPALKSLAVRSAVSSTSGFVGAMGEAGGGSAKLSKVLRAKIGHIENATAAGGNRGVSGIVSAAEAQQLGERFVGPEFRVGGGGDILISDDGLRQFRPPSEKVGINPVTNEPFSKTGMQANFQSRALPEGRWTSNVHIDVRR